MISKPNLSLWEQRRGETPARAVPVTERLWSPWKCVFGHAVLVAVCVLISFAVPPADFLWSSGALVAPYFFYMVYLEWKRTAVKITPVSVYLFWQGFALGVAAIYMGVTLQDGHLTPFGRHGIEVTSIAGGYLVGLVGTLPLHAGLQAFRPPRSAGEVEYKVGSLLPQLAFFFVVGAFILGMGDKLGALGGFTSSFELAGHAALFSFLSIPQERLKWPAVGRLSVLLICTLILLAVSATTGAKVYYMLAVLGLLIYVLESKRVARHLPLIGALFLMLYLTVVAPTVAKSRQLRSLYGHGRMEAQLEAFKSSPLYTGEFHAEFYSEQAEILANRLFEASSIGFIYQDVQIKGHLGGETFARLRYAFIPRFLWPDKPWVAMGAWFSSYTGASPREKDSTFALGMEAAGELYWNFGYGAVLVGMFLIGAMEAGLWRLAGEDPRRRPLQMCLYTYISLGMVNMPEASTRFVSCTLLFLVYGTLIYLSNLRKTKSKAVVFRRLDDMPSGIN